ncbi:uncharacterized protein GLRG_07625 [Colletotrichum graminicola M1.001]|uniref:Uncharacterized protein n=1 Tax=Colletotrichum graminicola (strain M1.001 / M2 / FGSC 10212) TaxID=645133 RepID=E3QP23_COLGM|nr:uncharacterized protein GLRG_07625 [Colletotrichum graminicola M1.001]EFQ32611.1 hypothetical protein GLRG_07625 [Colletotrichum graminicola M1.001]
MASDLLEQATAMADLDQTEICQLKQALAQAQAKIKRLEELKELDQTEIVIAQARVDELTKLVESLQGQIGCAEEDKSHDGGGVQQDPQTNGVHVDIHPDLDSPVEDEGVGINLNGLDIDDTAKNGQLSVSDSGFEGYGSDDDSDFA